jgi:ElaB/YqjD/DUF883 family membrane-anchored ribosome-binding protein
MPAKSKALPARLKRPLEHKLINIELGNEKGKGIMTHSVLDQAGEQITDTAHRASRAAFAVADAIEDGVASARRAAKQGGHAAAELIDDTKRRVQRHPIETVLATFAAGITAGAVIGWAIRRKQA